MAYFRVVLSAPILAGVAWARVLDLAAHSEVIPLTSVTLDPARPPSTLGRGVALAVGSRFVARTALGPLGFDDEMVVEVLRPPLDDRPGFARIRKQGKCVHGWIDLVVCPLSAGRGGAPGSRVVWSQTISLWGVPRALDPVVAVCGRAAYGWALRRLLDHGGPLRR